MFDKPFDKLRTNSDKTARHCFPERVEGKRRDTESARAPAVQSIPRPQRAPGRAAIRGPTISSA